MIISTFDAHKKMYKPEILILHLIKAHQVQPIDKWSSRISKDYLCSSLYGRTIGIQNRCCCSSYTDEDLIFDKKFQLTFSRSLWPLKRLQKTQTKNQYRLRILSYVFHIDWEQPKRQKNPSCNISTRYQVIQLIMDLYVKPF